MTARGPGRRLALLAAAAFAALATAALPARAAGGEEPARPLSFLRVGPASGPSNLPQIVDQGGRPVLLRGVNVDGIVDYWLPDPNATDGLRTPYPIDPAAYAGGACPPDEPAVEGVRVCDFDFSQMRPLGFDNVRLNLSWSLLEPQPGQISGAYLDRIAQIVDWARAQGIYVVLDMHQDAWSKYIYSGDGQAPSQACVGDFQPIRGYDGAPRWASQHYSPACALHGVRELDPAVAEDFQNLYNNTAAPNTDGVRLQDDYAHAMLALAQRFAGDPTVAGYEVINEPSPGLNPTPSAMDATELFPFYAKVVDTVVHDVPAFRQLFFIEPNTERDVTDNSAIVTPWSAYSAYPNVVYAPHIYTGVFTLDQQVASQRFFPSDGGYNSAIADAKALGLPLWVGEFGNNPADDETILRNHYALQDKDGLGGTLWLWKENANDVNATVFWGIYGPPFGPGAPQPKRIKFVDRAYPLATAGTLQSLSYDPDHSGFDLRASSGPVSCGDRAHATLVFVPAGAPGEIRADGAAVEVFSRGPAREAYVYPDGGPYRVYLGPAGTSTPTCVVGAGAAGATVVASGAAAEKLLAKYLSLRLPSGRRCLSRRKLSIHLRPRRGARIEQIKGYVNGRPWRIRRRGRGTNVALTGLPFGTFRVRLVVRLRVHGRRLRLTTIRNYRTCRARRRGAKRHKGRRRARPPADHRRAAPRLSQARMGI
ncbi:MAG: glycoside hydrolase family 5 protein [Actinobacteria bacterium]|nr:MAG: glycoside hydrolase family 5 protein [Actinomycetota bacterium]